MSDRNIPSKTESLLDEAAKFIRGFAASGESGFVRQRAALDWLTRYESWDETKSPRYLRPWVGTAMMYSARMNLAVSDQWCQGFNACLNAIDAAAGGFCPTDSGTKTEPAEIIGARLVGHSETCALVQNVSAALCTCERFRGCRICGGGIRYEHEPGCSALKTGAEP